jgi:hypothetical protein
MSYTPPREKKSMEMTLFSDVLPAVGKQLNLESTVQKWAVLQLWSQVVEAPFLDQTEAYRIKTTSLETVLFVKARTAYIAQELQFQLKTILVKLNVYAPQTGMTIDRIEVKVQQG